MLDPFFRSVFHCSGKMKMSLQMTSATMFGKLTLTLSHALPIFPAPPSFSGTFSIL